MAEEVLARAAGRVPRELAEPVVARVRLTDTGTPLPGAERIAESGAELTRTWHPALRAWLTAAGWEEIDGTGMRLSPTPRGLEDPRVAALRVVLGDEAADAVLRGRKPRVLECHGVRIRCSAGRMRMLGRAVRGSVLEVLGWIEEQEGLACADQSWLAAAHELSLAVRIQSSANPAQAAVQLPGGEAELCGAFEAVSVLERVHLDHPVVVDPRVLDVAEMAGAAGLDRAGLTSAQDEVVSALCATSLGAVLAAPPGAGKTVMCAAMLAERAPSSVLIATPAAVLAQWERELARFAPKLAVAVVRESGSLTAALGTHTVVVVSHQCAARWAERARRRVEVVVVDEAAALLRSSGQAKGLWKLRRRAEIGFALTGTPGEHGSGGGTGELVAWARGLPRGGVPELVATAYEPVLAGLSARAGVPEVVVELAGITPSEKERGATEAVLREEIPARGLERVRAAKQRAETLARPCGGGSKLRAAVERVSEHTRSGRSALVCTSSLEAAEEVRAGLVERGVRTEVLNTKSRQRRLGMLAAFAAGDIEAMVVTPASQRGVNLQRADLVVHLDLPESVEVFTQRNGRAARFGSEHARVVAWVPYLAGTVDESWVKRFLGGACDPLELS